jgi:hypothetical protein
MHWEGKPPELPGLGWRIAVTILTGVSWLSFTIIWMFFFAGSYDAYRNLAVLLASLLIALGTIGGIWLGWGLRYGRQAAPDAPEWKHFQEARLRAVLTIVLAGGWSVAIIAWLWSFASMYNVYQNIAVFIVSLILLVGASWAIWATWSRRYHGPIIPK